MYHKLMTEELKKSIPTLYASESKTAFIKFFSCFTGWTWYAIEFDGKDIFYGYVKGDYDEWGYFSLKEFEDINKSKGFAFVERDLYFKPTPIQDLI